MVEPIFTKLPPRVRMEIKNNHKNFQLDRIHRDRDNMEFSCVKFDILMFTSGKNGIGCKKWFWGASAWGVTKVECRV